MRGSRRCGAYTYSAPDRPRQGPKDKHTAAFKERTLLFEEAAAAQAAAGEGLPAFVYTASADVVDGVLAPVPSGMDPGAVKPVMDLPQLLQGIDFGGDKLRLMYGPAVPEPS